MTSSPVSSSRRQASPPLLQADGVSFGYPGVPVFEGFTAAIGPGATLVRGGDGRGKSTLLRLLAGELPTQAGRLSVNGAALAADPAGYRRQVFRPEITTPPESAQATPPEVFAELRSRWPAFDAARLERAIDGLTLREHLGKRLFMLSTGSRRKVWLAAAFAAGAPVTLLDDPFAALDRPSIRFAVELLREAAPDVARAIVFTAYDAPEGLPLAAVIDLGD